MKYLLLIGIVCFFFTKCSETKVVKNEFNSIEIYNKDILSFFKEYSKYIKKEGKNQDLYIVKIFRLKTEIVIHLTYRKNLSKESLNYFYPFYVFKKDSSTYLIDNGMEVFGGDSTKELIPKNEFQNSSNDNLLRFPSWELHLKDDTIPYIDKMAKELNAPPIVNSDKLKSSIKWIK